MKRILNTLGVVLALGMGFTSCQEKVRELEFTDKGPNMTVEACTESVYMGEDIKFDVTLSDDEFALSTLKAYLLFDGTVVSEFYLRTKEYAKYEGNVIHCPLLAKIPDGVAQLALVAQNVGMGITTDTLDITVTRPNFDELTLVSNDLEYTLEKTADYQYAMKWDLPADLPAYIKTPAINEAGDVITLGWDGSSIAVGADDPIPFSQNNAGTYEVKVNLMTLEASPFGTLSVPITESQNVQVVDLIQGASLVFPGIPEIFTWDFDFDFFRLEEDNTVTFKAINGKYRLDADYAKKFIRIDMWDAERNDYAKMNLDNPAASAIYAIGDGIGKPVPGYSWNTTAGAWCLAQHEPNVYQITFVGGRNIPTTGLNWKIFNERGWGNNFAYTVTETDYAVIKDDGNIGSGELPLKDGKGYTFKFDLRDGEKAVKFSVEEVDVPTGGLDIKVNGVAAQKVSATLYKVPVIELKKGDVLTPEGVLVDASWYLDPDYLTAEGKFAAMDGYYAINIYLDGKYFLFQRVDKDGNKLTAKDGALWMMGWGITNSYWETAIKDQNQIAFNPGAAFCMAEVEPKVFQITGLSFDPETGDKIDGRWRFNDLSIKWFGQDGWGDEKGKIFGSPTTVELTDRAKELVSDQGNLELVVSGMDGDKKVYKPLEVGVTYVLRIDLSQDGKEIVDFYKK